MVSIAPWFQDKLEPQHRMEIGVGGGGGFMIGQGIRVLGLTF